MPPVKIIHFSDILCVWALVGERNLARLVETHGSDIEVEVHFCSVFPDTQTKISRAWQDRGGFDGYAAHVRDVAGQFGISDIHPDTWTATRPRSSASPHLFLQAVSLLTDDRLPFAQRASVKAAGRLREAFFHEGHDVSNWKEQARIAESLGLRFDDILEKIETGEAIASLSAEYDLAQVQGVQGSPTYILNEGRQKLFGNIGYEILEANLRGIQSQNNVDQASSCA